MSKLIDQILFRFFPLIFVIFTFSFLTVSPVLALSWERKEIGANKLHVEGECSGKEVTVYLYSKDRKQEIASGGTECKKGKFKFEDDLTPWNIPDNSYNIVVGEGQGNPDFGKTERISVWQRIENAISHVLSSGPSEPAPPPDPNEPFVQASGNFSSNLQGLADSLETMKQSFNDTTYSAPVKAVLSGFLSVLETVLTTLKDISEKISIQLAQPQQPLTDVQPSPAPSLSPQISPSSSPQPTIEEDSTPASSPTPQPTVAPSITPFQGEKP